MDRISAIFSALIPNQYDASDRAAGYITSVDRQGNPARFSLMTISFGCVRVVPQEFKHYSVVVERAKELLKEAKALAGNSRRCG